MKKLLAIAMMFVAGLSSAQVTIIPKAGMSLFTVDFDESEGNVKSKPGLIIGAAFNFGISEVFSIQPEINFIQKGFKSDFKFTEQTAGYTLEESTKIKFSISYLELPVSARFTFGSTTRFYFYAGPSLGFGLGGKVKVDYSYYENFNGDVFSESLTRNSKVKFGEEPDNYEGEDAYINNRIDFGSHIGAGVIIAQKITIDTRYSFGLTDLDDNYTSKNRGFQFTVGVPISIN